MSPKKAVRLRDCHEKLFQGALDSVTQGLRTFSISKQKRGFSGRSADLARSVSPPATPLPATPPQTTALLSPPATPQHKLPLKSQTESDMNRSMLHGRPPAGPYGPQDARSGPQAARAGPSLRGPSGDRPSSFDLPGTRGGSNLAVQPAAAPVKISLKKAAVKIVRPAGMPSTPRPATPLMVTPVNAASKTMDSCHQSATTKSPITTAADECPSTPPSASSRSFIKIETPDSVRSVSSVRMDAAADLAARHARLQALLAERQAPGQCDTEEQVLGTTSQIGPKSRLSGEDGLATKYAKLQALKADNQEPSAPKLAASDVEILSESFEGVKYEDTEERVALHSPLDSVVDTTEKLPRPASKKAADSQPKEELEQQYLFKASQYLDSISTKEGASHLIQTVATKLRNTRAPLKLDSTTIDDDMKCARAEAVVAYINKSQGPTDFLKLCVQLIEDRVLTSKTLDSVVDLCNVIVELVLPREMYPPAPADTTTPKPKSTVQDTLCEPAFQPLIHDPMIGAKAWPAQVKRDKLPGCRTALLKGLSTMATVNKVQALVWGGRLESIMVDYEKLTAMVRFLTAEGCQRYFDATANGIEVENEGKRFVVLVDCAPGPNSVNDVLKNCAEGNASRCVRATDADEDWQDGALAKFAEGKGKVKRELDHIKRGRLANGRYCIDFRFSSLHSALSFKRELTDDEDWEHCSISYSTDPCETAQGVHPKDANGFYD